MTPEAAALLVEDLRSLPCRVRLKVRGRSIYDWDWPMFSPSPSYLETAKSGPVNLSFIECIDIEKEERKHRGALTGPVVIEVDPVR